MKTDWDILKEEDPDAYHARCIEAIATKVEKSRLFLSQLSKQRDKFSQLINNPYNGSPNLSNYDMSDYETDSTFKKVMSNQLFEDQVTCYEVTNLLRTAESFGEEIGWKLKNLICRATDIYNKKINEAKTRYESLRGTKISIDSFPLLSYLPLKNTSVIIDFIKSSTPKITSYYLAEKLVEVICINPNIFGLSDFLNKLYSTFGEGCVNHAINIVLLDIAIERRCKINKTLTPFCEYFGLQFKNICSKFNQYQKIFDDFKQISTLLSLEPDITYQYLLKLPIDKQSVINILSCVSIENIGIENSAKLIACQCYCNPRVFDKNLKSYFSNLNHLDYDKVEQFKGLLYEYSTNYPRLRRLRKLRNYLIGIKFPSNKKTTIKLQPEQESKPYDIQELLDAGKKFNIQFFSHWFKVQHSKLNVVRLKGKRGDNPAKLIKIGNAFITFPDKKNLSLINGFIGYVLLNKEYIVSDDFIILLREGLINDAHSLRGLARWISNTESDYDFSEDEKNLLNYIKDRIIHLYDVTPWIQTSIITPLDCKQTILNEDDCQTNNECNESENSNSIPVNSIVSSTQNNNEIYRESNSNECSIESQNEEDNSRSLVEIINQPFLTKVEPTINNISSNVSTSYSEEPPIQQIHKIDIDKVDPIYIDSTYTSQSRKNFKSKRILAKKDHETSSKKNALVGLKGELCVVKAEINRLISENVSKHIIDKIQHLSLISDSYGYDILSFNCDGSPRYIEVKTTTRSSSDFSFEITANEYQTALELGENYYIYIVFNITSLHPKIWPIKNPFTNGNIVVTPIKYRVDLSMDIEN